MEVWQMLFALAIGIFQEELTLCQVEFAEFLFAS